MLIAGGLSVARQALAGGLVDELSLHVSSVLPGGGARLFDAIGTDHIGLEATGVSRSRGVTHLQYKVLK